MSSQSYRCGTAPSVPVLLRVGTYVATVHRPLAPRRCTWKPTSVVDWSYHCVPMICAVTVSGATLGAVTVVPPPELASSSATHGVQAAGLRLLWVVCQ